MTSSMPRKVSFILADTAQLTPMRDVARRGRST
jgi:hypothetical protein